MAYMNQEKKAKILATLKPAVPKDWKWSLGVRHHSTIVLTIKAAPVDLIEVYTRERCADGVRAETAASRHMSVNPYHWRDHFEGELASTFERIFAALNLDNHDRSDLQSDYFDVGHYVEVHFGRWDKPFQVAR